MGVKLFVGSLPWSINDKALEEIFQKYGTVYSAIVIIDSATSRSKGFGFVEMASSKEANEAIRALHNSELDGRTIIVNEAKAGDKVEKKLKKDLEGNTQSPKDVSSLIDRVASLQAENVTLRKTVAKLTKELKLLKSASGSMTK